MVDQSRPRSDVDFSLKLCRQPPHAIQHPVAEPEPAGKEHGSVEQTLAAGGLVLIEGHLTDELQHHLPAICALAKKRKVSAWHFKTSKALRAQKSWP